MPAMTRGQLMDGIVSRADSDPTFRDRLLRDPRGVVSRHLGLTIPAWVNVEIVRETPDTYYVVLPRRSHEGAELQDHELERVAGGLWDKTCSGKVLDTYIAMG